jgi:tetratricopeptide (TPR) repeat protein
MRACESISTLARRYPDAARCVARTRRRPCRATRLSRFPVPGPSLRRCRAALAGGALAVVAWVAAPLAVAAEPPAAAVAAHRKAIASLGDGTAATAARSALADFETALRLDPDNLRWGGEYRQAAIAAGEFDRSIDFFAALAKEHPRAAATRLNLGYAHVDKIPAAGAITQVILANTALNHFSAALELEESWLVRYTRGNSYVYWPPIFGKTRLGIADLERAIELAEALPKRAIHARAWVALGDGHWRLDDLAAAHRIWQEGLRRYPGDADLTARLSREGEALAAFLDASYALGKKVDTDLSALWEAP